MKKEYMAKNNQRKALVDYVETKHKRTQLEKDEKEKKAVAKEVLAELAREYKTTEKTSFVYVTVRLLNKVAAIIYKETKAKGAIDWQAYAMALGGTAEGAEAYRKPDNTRTSIDWATDKELEELGL